MKTKVLLALLAVGVVLATEEETPMSGATVTDPPLPQEDGIVSMKPRLVPLISKPQYVLVEGPLVGGPKGTLQRMFRMNVNTGHVEVQHWFDFGDEKVGAYWVPILENDVGVKLKEVVENERKAKSSKAATKQRE